MLLAADGVSLDFMSFSGKCVEAVFSKSTLASGGAKKRIFVLRRGTRRERALSLVLRVWNMGVSDTHV